MDAKPDLKDKPWKYSIEVPLSSTRNSNIVYNTLKVDKEPRPKDITKELFVKEGSLLCNWSASSPQFLRVAVNSFFENISLILETIEHFDPNI